MTGGASGARRDAMRQGLIFTLVRAATPGETIVATESTPVGPGDMVKVKVLRYGFQGEVQQNQQNKQRS